MKHPVEPRPEKELLEIIELAKLHCVEQLGEELAYENVFSLLGELRREKYRVFIESHFNHLSSVDISKVMQILKNPSPAPTSLKEVDSKEVIQPTPTPPIEKKKNAKNHKG